ncbi:MAG TPA: hypothetical protein PLS81_04125 [Deltaproteobacteria bacterium]|nr:hypothetical protein [Deltaproteobacteria bacterium]HOM28630.1 hypothetical protein [Deltaproteobacteria bacterium]HPP81378.1 hypothetical protein [Deltaproteobacteria bacterium]
MRIDMNLALPALFIVLGAADLAYGLYRHDAVSMVMGAAMVALAAWIIFQRKT